MTKEFAIEVLQIPTVSKREDLMIEFIKSWCKSHGVSCSENSRNLYLTKGSAPKFYPCFTSHMDTVHHDQEKYIDSEEMLPIEQQGDKLFIEGSGVGADCKAGIAICLDLLD